MGEAKPGLTIVIPALDEEEAIGSTIERCLEAREHIRERGGVGDVEIIAVSDGSSDRTEEIARGFPEVTVLAFERNRGYGAAIKCGFEAGSGDLVGFLDADGTCDPSRFGEMCRVIGERKADVVLGSRFGPESEMPWIRTVGNTIFAWMLGILSQRSVGDTASGMRVIRRSALPDLYPLPDGLHFTPAMSARVLLQEKLELVEVPMPYAERVGQSKLSVVRDGVRFFTVIVQAAMCYRPARPLLLAAGVLSLTTFALGIGPVSYWLSRGELREPMIYRILFSALLATVAALVVCSAIVAEHIAAEAHGRAPATSRTTSLVARLFTRTSRRIGGALLVGGAVLLSLPGIVEYATTAQVHMHWSRAVASSLLLVVAAMLGVTTFLLNMMDLIRAQRGGRERIPWPDRVHYARSPGTP